MSITNIFPNAAEVREIGTQFAHHNTLMKQLVLAQGGTVPNVDWAEIAAMTRSGAAPVDLTIGDQLVDTWQDATANLSYQCPWDVAHFPASVEKRDGTALTNVMILQWHYATPFGVSFSGYPALFVCVDGLPAGTYNFTIANAWGKLVVGTYKFTLAQAIPAGGHIVGVKSWPDVAPETWRLDTYSSQTSTTKIETVTVTSGSDGTAIGTIQPNTVQEIEITVGGTSYTTKVNGYQCSAYGYNRWRDSALRKWLNSDETAWWTPQNDFDRAPDQAASKAGFLTGLPGELKAILTPVKIKTALNSADAKAEGKNFDETYDKIFVPSLQEIYVSPQLEGEGEVWEKYKEINGSATPYQQGNTYPNLRTYDVGSHASSQTVRLRSAGRGGVCTTWCVYSSGTVGGDTGGVGYVRDGYVRVAPACVIC